MPRLTFPRAKRFRPHLLQMGISHDPRAIQGRALRNLARRQVTDEGNCRIVLERSPHADQQRIFLGVGRAAAEAPRMVVLEVLGKEDGPPTAENRRGGNGRGIRRLVEGPGYRPPIAAQNAKLPESLTNGFLDRREARIVLRLPFGITIEEINIPPVGISSIASDSYPMEPGLLLAIREKTRRRRVHVPGQIQRYGKYDHCPINDLRTFPHRIPADRFVVKRHHEFSQEYRMPQFWQYADDLH
jgi:hypothetical protein